MNMKSKVFTGSRILLGLLFVVFGLNFFFHFIPQPPPPEIGGKFLGALFATGYMFPVIKTIEVLAGVALLSGLFAPLAAILLAPIIVNIVLYHTILDPAGAPLAIIILLLELIVLVSFKPKYDALLKMK